LTSRGHGRKKYTLIAKEEEEAAMLKTARNRRKKKGNEGLVKKGRGRLERKKRV